MPRPWAVILAGGEGSRLHAVTTALTGEPTPKQFCRLLGETTLLDETRQRLTGIVDDRRTVLLLSSNHRRYYEDLTRGRLPSLMAEQPANQGTAVGMAFALGRIRHADRDAVVGFFPSDHHYTDVGVFRRAVAAAYRIAAQNRDRLVLVGAKPHTPESEYGWIEPGPALNWPEAEHQVFAVNRFWEKPEAPVARRLFKERCLWSTFITVGTVEAFHAILLAAQPSLATAVDAIASAGSIAEESRVVGDVYRRLPPLCFSSRVLGVAPERCVVVPLGSAGWVDIGRPERLADARRPVSLSA